MIVEKRRSGKLPFLFFSIIISLFLCVYNDSLVFVYFFYIYLIFYLILIYKKRTLVGSNVLLGVSGCAGYMVRYVLSCWFFDCKKFNEERG